MKLREATQCPNCERLARRTAQQDAEIAALKAQWAEALARIAQLEQQLAAARKNSSTSSKPPSSDIVKPKKPLLKGGRSGSKAANRDMSSTCGRRSHPRRSTSFCPTRSIAARTAAAHWSVLGVRRKCFSKWKSPPARPALPSTKDWPTGARTAARFIMPRCRRPWSTRGCSARA